MSNNLNNDSEDDWSDTQSIDSCEAYINFESIRDPSTQLEEAVSFSWPGIYQHRDDGSTEEEIQQQEEDRVLRKITISTLLEEDDLAPLFGGCQWAGTRLWGAAVLAIQYLAGHLEMDESNSCGSGAKFELRANVVLTDQEDILTQLEKNVEENFPSTVISNETSSSDSSAAHHYIRAMPLSWSRAGVHSLLENFSCQRQSIDELLRINPKCVVVSSMERRGPADGIDLFIEEMKGMEYVGSVEKVYYEEKRKIEIYVTRGLE
ncbi:lysine methyltransferase [Skeletonema marinoi]|uniref:Lysine methyltransferase n=1 Tax=Skeletonema marinoi TaxID=267567 RepID=A0AAD8YHU0_9STRA|nr:lysine methyltransferase [Skeletonema marinoi]